MSARCSDHQVVEAGKHAKYGQLCQLLASSSPPPRCGSLRCLPAVLTDFGGIGRELYSAIIQPRFQHCGQPHEAEVEEGNLKSGWAATGGRGEAPAAPLFQGHLDFPL